MTHTATTPLSLSTAIEFPDGCHRSPPVAFVSSVVGRGARVLGPGRIERCVIWPESVAHAPLSGCVVTPNSVLRVSPPAAP